MPSILGGASTGTAEIVNPGAPRGARNTVCAAKSNAHTSAKKPKCLGDPGVAHVNQLLDRRVVPVVFDALDEIERDAVVAQTNEFLRRRPISEPDHALHEVETHAVIAHPHEVVAAKVLITERVQSTHVALVDAVVEHASDIVG